MHNAVADFYFLLFIHERLGEVGIMAVLDGRASDECRPIRNRFFLCCGGQIFACRKDRCSRTNCADRRHVNVLRGDDNERAGGSCVCVNERVGRDFDLVERVYDLGRCVEAAAVRVHVENDGGSVVALGCFDRPPQKRQQRRCDFTMQGHHDDVAFLNGLARGSRRGNAKHKSEAYADRKHLHLSS